MMFSSDIGWFGMGMVPQVPALGPLLHSTAMLRGGALPRTGHSIPKQRNRQRSQSQAKFFRQHQLAGYALGTTALILMLRFP